MAFMLSIDERVPLWVRATLLNEAHFLSCWCRLNHRNRIESADRVTRKNSDVFFSSFSRDIFFEQWHRLNTPDSPGTKYSEGVAIDVHCSEVRVLQREVRSISAPSTKRTYTCENKKENAFSRDSFRVKWLFDRIAIGMRMWWEKLAW